jgi:hypothetical protein
MFQFVYQPQANRESLRDFNARIGEFFSENAVINIEACAVGPNLMIQGQTADEMDLSGVPTYKAVVRSVDLASKEVEEEIDGMIDAEELKHNPDDENGETNWPVKVIFVEKNDKSMWAVLMVMNGVAEDDNGPDEGDQGSDAPVPAPVGFQPEPVQ